MGREVCKIWEEKNKRVQKKEGKKDKTEKGKKERRNEEILRKDGNSRLSSPKATFWAPEQAGL